MTDSGTVDHKNPSTNNKKKIMIGTVVSAAVALVLATALPGLALAGATDTEMSPTDGYDIHVTVGRHDSAHLDAQMDHYCKLDSRIVAVCQLYAHDNNATPGTGPVLSQIEFIITEEQYKQLPEREKPNWHNHAVELTPERGNPSCIELPEGLECGALVEILKTTYGKVITIWDPADPVPSYPPYAFLVDSPFALGQDLNDNLHKEWLTSYGEDASSPSLECAEQVKLTVKAVGPNGEDRRMFIRIGENGEIIAEGFAPFEFEGVQGNTYQVRATNFDGLVFDQWADDGSTNRHRMVTLNADLELVAQYKTAAESEFSAQLSGGKEVPPVETQATGAAELKLNEDASELSYKVSVAGIDKVSMAHLHLGPEGVNGPVVATLYNEAPGGAVDGVLTEGIITSADLSGPLAGKTVGDLVDEITSGNVYVNVHTTDYPGGEIRGQAS